MSTIEINKQAVRAFVEAINARDWTELRRVVADSFTRTSLAGGGGVSSGDELVAFLQREAVTFPDAHESIDDMIAEGDRVAVRHSFRGRQAGPLGDLPPTHRVLASTYIAIYRLEQGKIVEAWAEWDNLYTLRALGHWTADN